jgi:mRNA-degrading endonuclease toxin of MazEF toxin-antitoxin module
VKRGEIYTVDLTAGGRLGVEQDGERPAVVVSNDKFNSNVHWKSVIVVPFSASPTQQERNYGVIFKQGTGGLTSDCVALTHQIVTVDRSRLGKLRGELSPKEMAPLDMELKIILYLP